MRRLAPLALLLALLIAAVPALGAGGTTVKTRSTKLGTILVNAKGVTLYLWEADHRKSTCYDACAKGWPPLIAKGKLHAGGGAKASKLGTVKRKDGTRQVTYGGHPLYTFIGDHGTPGRTTGQDSKAFGADWYVVSRSGHAVHGD
jgi:predicted lipoprotein with Yx(FWY)xxD motif